MTGYVGTWMSQEVRINGWQIGCNLLINAVYWGYNPLIRSPLIRSLPVPGHPSGDDCILGA